MEENIKLIANARVAGLNVYVSALNQ